MKTKVFYKRCRVGSGIIGFGVGYLTGVLLIRILSIVVLEKTDFEKIIKECFLEL
jgi:hypothetical protein